MISPETLLAPEVTDKFVREFGLQVGIRMHQVVTSSSPADFIRSMIRLDRAIEQSLKFNQNANFKSKMQESRDTTNGWIMRETIPRLRRQEAF